MKALFLESRAAQEVAKYARLSGLDDGGLASLLEVAYKRGEEYPNAFRYRGDVSQSYEDWWISKCLHDDSHKDMDINRLITWAPTPEGKAFWSDICRCNFRGEWP